MIQVAHVSRRYGKKHSAFMALDDISFTVPDGKTVAIVGKSGSGKSTLMQLLGGLDHPTSGEITIAGNALSGLNRKGLDKFRASQLGFVFQSFFVEPNLNCYQNVGLPLEINEVPKRKRKEMIEAALEQVELSDKLHEKAKNLSGGQKQRLAIARAIVNAPAIILADEPTGNLDSTTGDRIMKLLFGLHDQLGSTLVIVTHDSEIAAQCDVQVHIKDGKILSVDGLAKKVVTS